MTNLDAVPTELVCAATERPAGLQVLAPRDVPLGGLRAMTVRRTLPQRARSLIGAWCFVDHYGPDDVAVTGGMQVPPHPHTGLATVSWLFSGEVEHRDSLGTQVLVRPGELNLMTAGRGIAHSETSTAGTRTLHGVQLWIALPAAGRDVAPTFEHVAARAVTLPGATLRVFLGSLAGSSSPVVTATRLLGAELRLDAGASLDLDLDPDVEHGYLVDTGPVVVDGTPVPPGHLCFSPTGATQVRLTAPPDRPAVLIVLGGVPLGERLVMWWNFVGGSHEEVVAARHAWQAELDPRDRRAARRFGVVPGDLPPLPAPELPATRLLPRA